MVAKVEEARMDSCSRNLYRHEDLKMAVDIEKVLAFSVLFSVLDYLHMHFDKKNKQNRIRLFPGERSFYLHRRVCGSSSSRNTSRHGQYFVLS